MPFPWPDIQSGCLVSYSSLLAGEQLRVRVCCSLIPLLSFPSNYCTLFVTLLLWRGVGHVGLLGIVSSASGIWLGGSLA